jgi:hypothetical protein
LKNRQTFGKNFLIFFLPHPHLRHPSTSDPLRILAVRSGAFDYDTAFEQPATLEALAFIDLAALRWKQASGSF